MSIQYLPSDNILNILSFLEHRDLIIIRLVSKDLFNLAHNGDLWKSIDLGKFNTLKVFKILKFIKTLPTSLLTSVESITIPNSVKDYRLYDIDKLTSLCSNVKNFRLISDRELNKKMTQFFTDNDQDSEDYYEWYDYHHNYDKKNIIRFELFQVINNWKLEKVEIIGNGTINIVQDCLKFFFLSQPNLIYFKCDFNISSKLLQAPRRDALIYGTNSMLYFALRYCKEIETIDIPRVIVKKHMLEPFMTLEETHLTELYLSLQPFPTVQSAEGLANKFISLRYLRINLEYSDSSDSLSYVGYFISSLPCIQTVVINNPDCFDFRNMDISSPTLIRLEITDSYKTRGYTPTISGLSLSCPQLKTIKLAFFNVDKIHFVNTPSLNTIMLFNCIVKKENIKVPSVSIGTINCKYI